MHAISLFGESLLIGARTPSRRRQHHRLSRKTHKA
jgi:hypothetical protein